MNPYWYARTVKRPKRPSYPGLIPAAQRIAQQLALSAPDDPKRPVDLAQWRKLAAEADFRLAHVARKTVSCGLALPDSVSWYLEALRDAALSAGWEELAHKVAPPGIRVHMSSRQAERIGAALGIPSPKAKRGEL